MSPEWTIFLGWMTAAGSAGFILMGIDKARAVNRAWRIPEVTFFILAFMGGSFGILLGSSAFRHKTRKVSFMLTILLSAALWLGVLFAVQEAIGVPFG